MSCLLERRWGKPYCRKENASSTGELSAGAAVGLLIGWGMSQAVANFTPLPAEIPAWAITVSLGTAAITGMLFGLLPAYRASRLAPVAALRFE